MVVAGRIVTIGIVMVRLGELLKSVVYLVRRRVE
jgi:hypothetical protein